MRGRGTKFKPYASPPDGYESPCDNTHLAQAIPGSPSRRASKSTNSSAATPTMRASRCSSPTEPRPFDSAGSVDRLPQARIHRLGGFGRQTLHEFRTILHAEHHRIDPLHRKCVLVSKKGGTLPGFGGQHAKSACPIKIAPFRGLRRDRPIDRLRECAGRERSNAHHTDAQLRGPRDHVPRLRFLDGDRHSAWRVE